MVTLCNAGYKVTFTKIGCTISHCSKTILWGSKCTRTGLWMTLLCPTLPLVTSIKLDIPPPTAIAANVDATSYAGEYVHYIYQALCSPPALMLVQALK
jgi:hypothetical protein